MRWIIVVILYPLYMRGKDLLIQWKTGCLWGCRDQGEDYNEALHLSVQFLSALNCKLLTCVYISWIKICLNQRKSKNWPHNINQGRSSDDPFFCMIIFEGYQWFCLYLVYVLYLSKHRSILIFTANQLLMCYW
jgi:hypothetical protein